MGGGLVMTLDYMTRSTLIHSGYSLLPLLRRSVSWNSTCGITKGLFDSLGCFEDGLLLLWTVQGSYSLQTRGSSSFFLTSEMNICF